MSRRERAHFRRDVLRTIQMLTTTGPTEDDRVDVELALRASGPTVVAAPDVWRLLKHARFTVDSRTVRDCTTITS